MYSRGGFLEDFKSAFNRPNNAHVQLIIINVIVFVLIGILHVFLNEAYYKIYVYANVAMPSVPEAFLHKPWTLITYMFSHEGLFHILSNMLMLYWFGRIFVEYLGSDKLVAVYVLGGIFGGLFYLAAYNIFPYLNEHVAFMVGASAGVLAIIVATATLLPQYTIHLMFIGPVKIMYIALFAVVLSFLQVRGVNEGGNIAHLGGAFFGFLYIKQLQKGNDWGGWFTRFLNFIKSFFVPSRNIKVSYKKTKKSKSSSKGSSSTTAAPTSSHNQEEIDAILDKISEKGYESLSKEEKQKLFNASNR
ncbi:rhomboid family protein [Fulvivirga ligni]|uniref:rhomboid family protein n=1 Tax=Fulvivirga ligni TaxID=2904246 RepID=UPI001F229522|nr:rhomboid family intramembrane serine protease [Fulvivirga ligni]UII21415.1 rhomboid family intramembrane serine protease [Fulvivirga ligni]